MFKMMLIILLLVCDNGFLYSVQYDLDDYMINNPLISAICRGRDSEVKSILIKKPQLASIKDAHGLLPIQWAERVCRPFYAALILFYGSKDYVATLDTLLERNFLQHSKYLCQQYALVILKNSFFVNY